MHPETVSMLNKLEDQIGALLNNKKPTAKEVALLFAELNATKLSLGQNEFFGIGCNEASGEQMGEVVFHFTNEFGNPDEIIGKKWRSGAKVAINPNLPIPDKGDRLKETEELKAKLERNE